VQFHDIGALIWVFVILLGVVSSIRRSLGRARGDGAPSQAEQAQAARQQAAAQQAALAQQLQAQTAEQQRARAQLVAQQRVVTQPPRPARTVVSSTPVPAHSGIPVEPPPMHVYEEPRVRLAGSFATLFEKRSSMIRAIVAAEVLGSPKALAEQSIWSPRYTER
jgi:hypothetical protein